MEQTPVKFLLLFLLLASIGYALFSCAARLCAWVISRTIGGVVSFRVASLNSLKEISIQLKKGPVASVAISEIKLSIPKPPGCRRWNVLSWTPKIQIIISDVDVVLRKSGKKGRLHKENKIHKHNPTGRGVWMLITNILKHVNVSVNDIAMKLSETSTATMEIKELDLITSKNETHLFSLGLKLFMAPCILYVGEENRVHDTGSIFEIHDKFLYPGRVPQAEANGRFIIFALEQLVLTGNLDHDRHTGVVLKQLDVVCGKANLNLDMDMILEDKADDTEDVVPPEATRDVTRQNTVAKLVPRIPEQVQFSLPKLEVVIYQRAYNIALKNEIHSISIRGAKLHSLESPVDVMSTMDVQVEMGEIHICQEDDTSLIDIVKVAVGTSIEFPVEAGKPLRVEIDVKLGGTRCNLHMNRAEKWIHLISLKKTSKKEKVAKQPRDKNIYWSCSLSAPELAVSVYNLDGLALIQVSSQTSHVYIGTLKPVIHTEFGEIYVSLLEEGRKIPMPTGLDGTASSLIHVSRISLDSGVGIESEDGSSQAPMLLLETGASEVNLQLSSVKAVILALVAAETFVKRLPRRKRSNISKKRSKRGGVLKFKLEKLLVQYDSGMHVEVMVIPDPKKVNFGSQGGIVIVTKQEGGPRNATIKPADFEGTSPGCIKQKLSLVLTEVSVTVDRNKGNRVMELEQGRICYEEAARNDKPVAERTLLKVENVKMVYQHTMVTIETSILLTARNLVLSWDPDMHLFLYELMLHVKQLLRTQRPSAQREKPQPSSKPKLAFALDIEEASLVADLADGVEGTVYIKSVFSEDAAIGVLFERVDVALNKATVARAERLQLSRVPSVVTQDPQVLSEQGKDIQHFWDILIQGTGVQILMPYRLQLRAIEDAVEDMWRGLKLAMAEKRSLQQQDSFPGPPKPKKVSQFQVYCIKLHIRGISAEIEEEPLQGWLDEHYFLRRQRLRGLLVRERFLNESVNSKEAKREAWEHLQDQTFQEYKRACAKLVPSTGSGACCTGFQAGFRPSVKRSSLMTISASVLDVTLTEIEGGRTGMIKMIRTLDCVKPEPEVPFSRVIGRHVVISMSSLSVNLRDYTIPMLSASSANTEGNVIFAQQATRFQNQVLQDVFIGRWRKLEMLRSVSGSTPPLKFYSELPIHLESAKVCYGVGYEPAFADVSYAFTVALKKYNLSVRNLQPRPQPPKKEKSLPWWDDMRYYIHGVNSISCNGFEWIFLASTDPYESRNMMRMVSNTMRIDQTDGKLVFDGSNFDMHISSLESLESTTSRKKPQYIHAPNFRLDISMDWGCASGQPNNHYLHAFPSEPEPRSQVYDPYRSISFSLIWSFSLRADVTGDVIPFRLRRPLQKQGSFNRGDIPFMNLCAQDLIWIFKWWNLYFSPPHKLRSFSKWPRYKVERVPRSGNLSLDKVTTEFILRVDATPASIKHFSLRPDDDPAEGLTFGMQKLRYELCFSRGLKEYTFECKRDFLELVYQGLDIHQLKTKLKRSFKEADNLKVPGRNSVQLKEDGFLLSTDCFSIRRQSPKADPERLSNWRDNIQPGGSDFYKLSESESSDQGHSDRSDDDDDGFDVVLADNCLRVSLYGFKLFWTIPNRNAVWSWVADISKAFEAPKPSPSRQYAQRKLMEERVENGQAVSGAQHQGSSNSRSNAEEEEGALQFMVNVVQPQFNLHSEDAHGRFLLAAASGRVLARSFHSIFYVGLDDITQALEKGAPPPQGNLPEFSWRRRELSVILEHVQAHVAPTDVDPGAGLQWLPRIPREPIRRTGALLEPIFKPCSMYFRYTRHKGGTTDRKVKPLKELSFNSPEIAATMTSRQFHIMVDVMSSLLLARLPRPHRGEEEEDVEEESDEVVPDGVEEVELARVKLEKAERDVRLVHDDLKTIKRQVRDSGSPDGLSSPDQQSSGESPEGSLRKALTIRSALVRRLESDLTLRKKTRKAACTSLRHALQRAAQQRLMDKEKNKNSAAMRISWAIDRVAWTMLSDGKTFAEAEINNMVLNVDRDFKDNGVARFTIKSFVVKNCLHNAKSNMVLSAWNAPEEWGRNVMLRVDARQGAPKEGLSLLELFQVEIYPLRIYLTEAMYSMMWEYFFPADEEDPQKRQVLWKGSTTSVAKRAKKSTTVDSGHGKEIVQKANGTVSVNAKVAETSEHRRSASLDKWGDIEVPSENIIYSESLALVRTSTAPESDEILAATCASNQIVESDTTKLKETRKTSRAGKTSQEEKKQSRNRRIFLEIQTIKISQVELLVTYEGSKVSVSELRLLMDTFTRSEFTGSWRRLFSRVKKHIIWGVLKSVTGMQGKKFKDKMQAQVNNEDSDYNSSDSGSSRDSRERFPIPLFHKHGGDRAGEGFVSSIKGLFKSQKHKAKALVRTMRGEGHSEAQNEWRSDGEAGHGRQLNISKSRLLRRHSNKKLQSKGAILLGERYCSSSPRASPYHSDAEASSGSSAYEDFDQHFT